MIKETNRRKDRRLRVRKRAKRIKGKDALFGIWKDNPKVRSVEAYVDSLRGSSTLVEFFSRSPLRGVNLKIKRSRDTGRKLVRF